MAIREMIVAATLAVTAGVCSGQSFNIDLNRTSGIGAGVPANSYAGAAGQTGTWNNITDATPVTSTLVGLNGALSSVSFTRSEADFLQKSGAQTTGDFEKLMDDAQNTASVLTYTFSNLAGGVYLLFTYAGDPTSPSEDASVSVASSQGQGTQMIGGTFLGNQTLPGIVFAVHGKSVTPGGSLTVNVSATLAGDANVGGFQLKHMLVGQRHRTYVDKNEGGNGVSWDSPFSEARDAVQLARFAGGSLCEAWVASGFYPPTAGSDRSVSFAIPGGYHLFGGFAGDEATFEERDAPFIFITALTGAIGGGTELDDSYHVVTFDGGPVDTIIDGFSIVSGRATGSGDNNYGGGLRVTAGSPLIRTCKFINNEAALGGGAVHIEEGSPTFAGCLFYNNETDNGVGGAVEHDGANPVNFYDCQFISNFAAGDGGAIRFDFSPGNMYGCFFSGNSTGFGGTRGGAVHAAGEAADVDIVNCSFVNNFCNGDGGGVLASSGADLDVHNSVFWLNEDVSGGDIEDQQINALEFQSSFLTQSFTSIEGEDANPQFIDPDGNDNTVGTTDDNARVQPTSPLVDAGNNNVLPLDFADLDYDGLKAEQLPFDIASNPRFADIAAKPDTGIGFAPIVDIGAWEVVPTECAGDANNDGFTNSTDLNIILANFGCSGASCDGGDVNNDNAVNSLDLNVVLGAFGCTP